MKWKHHIIPFTYNYLFPSLFSGNILYIYVNDNKEINKKCFKDCYEFHLLRYYPFF